MQDQHRPGLRLFLIRAILGMALVLTACAPRPAAVTEATPSVMVTRPNFGDAKPHPWNGRAPSTYPVHGIDISRWQGEVDWPTARANGVNFAFLKATEGGDLVDPLFETNWHAARRAGVPVGAYHFWYHCRPPEEQARWFIRNVPRSPGALPPVLDMEWTPFSPTCRDRPRGEEIRAKAHVFLRMLEAHYGQRPIIYAPVDFYRDNEMWKIGGYEFWLRSVAGHPQDVFAGQHWTFWQYSGTGLVPGIEGRTDLNVFEGSPAQWSRWLGTRAR